MVRRKLPCTVGGKPSSMPAMLLTITCCATPAARSSGTICCVRLPCGPASIIFATASRTRGPSAIARCTTPADGCGAKIVRDELKMLPGQRGSSSASAGAPVQPPSRIQRGAAPLSGRPNQWLHSCASSFSLRLTRSMAMRGGADGRCPGRGCTRRAMTERIALTIGKAVSKATCSVTASMIGFSRDATA